MKGFGCIFGADASRLTSEESKLHAYDCGRLIDRFIPGGVDVIFGLPGNGINGIMEALRKREDAIRFIQVRHEASAAFMACSYAKHTGRLGCALPPQGLAASTS